MTPATAYIHIPGLTVDGPVDFVDGRIEQLDFESWYALDQSHYHTASKYERTRPCFWIGPLPLPDGTDSKRADELLSTRGVLLHRALLLDRSAPAVSSPLLSCMYLRLPVEGDMATYRHIGSAEREWIVYGGVQEFHAAADFLEMAAAIHGLLAALEPGFLEGSLDAALDVLERTARPDYSYEQADEGLPLSVFTQCVAASEGLLTAESTEKADVGLTERFGRHAAALFAPRHDDREAVARFYADVYRLRSQLMHGRLSTAMLDDAAWTRVREGRALLRHCATSALVLASRGVLPATLPERLAAAWADPVAFAALHTVLRGTDVD